MSSRGNIAGNPVLIGAATVLVILVAVFLSYNANQGLPFVPAYKLTAETPSAANLVRGNEVRIGGTRVGSVDSIGVERRDDGTSIAVLGLKLERSVDPLPKDSTILIRPRSALGLKYVEITRGTSDEGWADGDTIPLAQATPDPVEFDDFTNMFDDATRDASQTNLKEFGDALAGRGASINQAIGAFKPLLEDIIPVARNLSDPETDLTRLIVELSDAARIVAPAAEQQAQLFVNLDAHLRRAARGRPPVHPGVDLRGPGHARRGDRVVRGPAALPRQHGGAVPRAPAGDRVAREHRGIAGRRARGRDAHAAPLPAVQRPPRLPAGGGRGVLREPARPARHQAPDRDGDLAQADARPAHAGADHLQLPGAVVPQRRLAAVGGRQQRHVAAVHDRRHAARGRTTRAAWPRRRPTGRRSRTTCTPTRTRTPPRPASPRSARPATSRTSRAGP